MTNRRQYMIAGGLIVLALLVVGAFALARPRAPEMKAGGHDHAAMLAGGGADELKSVTLDAESARRIGVSYATAEEGPLTRTIRTVGEVTYDETHVTDFDPKIEGWVERLYVDFVGAPVRRGQPLMSVYSPMLVAAQEELVLAARLARTSEGPAAENARALLESSRRRLAYWDIPEAEIARIERTGTTTRTMTIRAPSGGVVVEKTVYKGARVMPGMKLFRIADLSTVWVEGEVFEKDLGLVKLGREAVITFEAYPGETFHGRVTYVYPTVEQQSRTGRVRIEMSNPGVRLKPGMYASIGFDVPVHLNGLHVPRTAVLTTGTRSIVFVQHADGSLMPHIVTVGQAAGDHIEILGGLKAGQVVVASAGFLVDAESNLGSAIRAMGDMGDMGDTGGTAPAAPAGAAAPAPSSSVVPPAPMPGMDMPPAEPAPVHEHGAH